MALVPAAPTAPAAAADTPRTAKPKLDTRTRVASVAECRIRNKTALAAVADPPARILQRSRVQFEER
jgi:hypothetical protein